MSRPRFRLTDERSRALIASLPEIETAHLPDPNNHGPFIQALRGNQFVCKGDELVYFLAPDKTLFAKEDAYAQLRGGPKHSKLNQL